MGVDHLDIVLRIKQTFGVELTQDEWPYLYDSAGWLHEVVCAKLDGRQPVIPDLFAIQARFSSGFSGSLDIAGGE
jgi:hypothetical protein